VDQKTKQRRLVAGRVLYVLLAGDPQFGQDQEDRRGAWDEGRARARDRDASADAVELCAVVARRCAWRNPSATPRCARFAAEVAASCTGRALRAPTITARSSCSGALSVATARAAIVALGWPLCYRCGLVATELPRRICAARDFFRALLAERTRSTRENAARQSLEEVFTERALNAGRRETW